MTQWVINRGDSQFSVDGLAQLTKLAKRGDLDAGDLIQPEGADDWLYAIEVPELAEIVKSDLEDDDEITYRSGTSVVIKGALLVVFLIMIIGGGSGIAYFAGQLPTGEESLLGEGGSLAYSELIVLTDANLYAEPSEKSAVLVVIPKDRKAELLAKRGSFYKANYEGKAGWLRVEDTLPVYQLGGDKIRRKLDPLYNPDQYTKVTNATFVQLDEEGNDTGTFRFMLENSSDYEVTDLHLRAVIKDAKGTEVASKEFEIEGVIPAKGSTMVGTLPPTDEELKAAQKAGEDPPPSRLMTNVTLDRWAKELPEEEQEEIYLRWLDGIDITVEESFTEAEVRIIQLRAVPE